MICLVDTHIALWAAHGDPRLPQRARALISDSRNLMLLSVASTWEMTIKAGRNRDDFRIDVPALRAGFLANGWTELPITGDHALAVGALPPIHGDPFDRLLIAQARVEGARLLTADRALSGYGDPVEMM